MSSLVEHPIILLTIFLNLIENKQFLLGSNSSVYIVFPYVSLFRCAVWYSTGTEFYLASASPMASSKHVTLCHWHITNSNQVRLRESVITYDDHQIQDMNPCLATTVLNKGGTHFKYYFPLMLRDWMKPFYILTYFINMYIYIGNCIDKFSVAILGTVKNFIYTVYHYAIWNKKPIHMFRIG
jgi:hypothetical protein